MATQIKSSLKELASVSQSLNRLSDEISEQLAEIEKSINRYNLGITAWANLRTTQMEEAGSFPLSRIDELRYTKLEGKWGLVWASYVAEDPENTWETKFLRESPREIRLLSVEKLPELLSMLAHKASELSSDAMERLREIKKLAAAISEQSSTEQ